MDILDIDEALKDDSYIFLAEKTHDDVSNILQQWKTNNQQQTQLQPQAHQLHLHYNNEQAYKLNSKTFTRPKRRSQAATNLETQFSQISQTQNVTAPTAGHGHTGVPMFSLEIGGLVTNMQKSFLQDTSPPSSICSSMNNDRMNNSLISSADFTNLNFLQSTNSLEPSESTDLTVLNMTTTTLTNDGGGYTLSDMIRDRKALESLTMSGDGTLIKDSHIGQIDDISLATLSKTASGCSTMDNSTDSVSPPNEVQAQQTMSQAQLRNKMLLSEEMIGDTTFSLVDSLTTPTTADSMSEFEINATFKRPTTLHTTLLNETLLLAGRQVNTTYTEGCDTPEASRCETPENVESKLTNVQMESTPLTTTATRFQQYNNNNNNNIHNNNNNKHPSYTPTLKERPEINNISPIVSSETPQRSHSIRHQLNHTYEPPTKLLQELQLEMPPGAFDSRKFVLDTMEMLEQIEQPVLDATYNMSAEHKQMQNVMDLAKAEVELLAQQGDEEQFENMLAELGKVNVLNAEQLKMQKSLNSIKRRFHKDEEHNSPVEQQQQPLEEVQHLTPTSSSQLLSSHSQSQSSNSGERLLSRRSRLYDDVNLSLMHDSNASTASCNSTSFIVHRRSEEPAHTSDTCTPLPETEEQKEPAGVPQHQQAVAETEQTSYKLAERRERDRERFKTIKITREMRTRDELLENIVVPCIDDDVDPQQQPIDTVEQLKLTQRQPSPPERLSRRDLTHFSSNNEGSSESSVNVSNNYLTYKKPKERSLLMRQRQPAPEQTLAEPTQFGRPEPRSLSRPRYISGLQKFTAVSKATSAGAGLNATTTVLATEAESTAAVRELKSPMGIKSKSFHNLSSNINGIAAPFAPRPSLGGGLRRPNVPGSKLMGGQRAYQSQEQDDTSLFKVPKLASSGLRAPATAAPKRAAGNGLARPSSGYYSMGIKTSGESETPESLSSASSRGSLYGKDSKANHAFDTQTLSSKLTMVTTGATGIPKPSGLRQPTQMKRSGLPRPSSIVRR